MKYIKTLEAHLDHWKRLYAEHICEEKEGMETIEALQAAIKALQTEPCEDAISRQAAIEFLEKPLSECCMMEYLKSAPSVHPTQKVGRWIEKDGYDGDVYYDCSACGNSWTTIDGTPWDNGMNFCPNCGAKMEEGE